MRQSLIQSIDAWIRRPDFKDHDKNLIAFYVQAIALIIIIVSSIVAISYLVAGMFAYVVLLIFLILFLTAVIGLIRVRKLEFGSNLFLISLLGLETLYILYGGGIHTSISVLYPVILIVASLILGRKAFIYYVILCAISIGGIIYAEHQRLIPAYVPDPPEFPLFISYLFMLVGSALLVRYITENLQNSLRTSRQNAQRLAAQKSMLDRVGQAVVGSNAENVIIYWNQAATDLYGYTEKEALGRKYDEIIPVELTTELSEAIRSAMYQDRVWSGELSAHRRDGQAISIIGSIASILNDQNKMSGWVAIATDLTEVNKAAQIANRRAQELSLLNQLGISLASGKDLYNTLLALQEEIRKLIQADAFYVAIYDEATDLVRFPIYFSKGMPSKSDSRPLHEQPGLTGVVILNGDSLYLPDMADPRVIETYHPLHGDPVFHTFLGIPLKVSNRIIGMMSVQSKAVNAYTSEQIQLMENVAIQAAVAIDKARLLDQLQAELVERKDLIRQLEVRNAESETLRETTAIVTSTLDASEAVHQILDQLKRVIPYDSASVWLYQIDKAIMVGSNGLPPSAMLPGEYMLNDNPPDYPLRAENRPYILLNDIQENYSQFREPSLNYIHSWLAIPLRARGKLMGFISLDGRTAGQFRKHDAHLAVTYANQVAIALENARLFTELQTELVERKKLFDDLENKNTELERFTYTVSHDLKAPLITIRGFLGFIAKDSMEGNIERLKGDIQRVTDATEKMQHLLRDLLELSRIGRLVNQSVNIPFEDLVREAIEILQGRISENGIEIHVQSDLPMIFGDKQRLVEVLQNLLDNAAKFMGNQPHPKIEVGQEGEENGQPIFFVKDNGIGIAPDHHDRVFGLFNKLDIDSEGTGVGLAIVKRIIEVHGGRIWVKSESGEGSIFYFTLPRGN
ncbi:MAG: GAF domain-containing protein [Anaerolineales bacterium]